MAEKSIKKNYIYNVTYQMLTIITPLITTPYLWRKLGADGLGIYSFTASIVAYFTMVAALGTARYGQREISYAQNDIEKRSSSFWKIETLSCVSTFISLIAYIIYVCFHEEYRDIYAIQALTVIAIATDITWFFQGLEEFGKIVRRNIFFRIISILLIFAIINSKDDLFLYVCGLSLITLISNISLWPFLNGYIVKPRVSDLKFWEIFPEVFMLFVPSIAISVYTVLDKTMIGVITKSSFENGFYDESLKISRMALTIVTSLGVVMVPRIGHLFFEGELEKVRVYMYKSFRFVWIAGIPLCFGLCSIADNMMPWFLGEGSAEVASLLRISSFLILAIGINNVTGVQYLIPTKRHNQFTITVMAGAVINFVLNYFLIRRFQSEGAAIASVIAETAIAIIQLVIVRKELSPLKIFGCSVKYFLSGLIMFFATYGLSKRMSPSIIHTIILILFGGTIYFVMLLVLRDVFLIDNLKRCCAYVSDKVIKDKKKRG